MTNQYSSEGRQQRLDSPIPFKALKSDFDDQTGVLDNATLQRLLFSDPVRSPTSDDSRILKFNWNTNEESSSNILPPSFYEDDSSLEPRPIDENKMEVLSDSMIDTKRFQFWRAQQQQHIKSLLTMVFNLEPSQNDTLDPLLSIKKNTYSAGSSSVDKAALKRGLDPFWNADDTSRPVKKQRDFSADIGDRDSSLASTVSINEESLNQYGLFRDYQNGQWSLRFEELVKFRKQKGHCCVPHGYQKHPTLGRWVKRQRYQYKLYAEGKQSTMTPERIAALKKLDFVWDSHGEA